ncbi:hypothetical protein GZH53_03615 [Flavihumibacter sp. R14]|nr:hypothetical protein [Flavihumibacter soli]
MPFVKNHFFQVSLLAITTLLGCNQEVQNTNEVMKVEFTGSQQLDGYPSGSTLSVHDDQIYLMGDDASRLLIIDSAFNIIEEVQLFSHTEGRINKAGKADIEASEWLQTRQGTKLWLFSSGSLSPQRDSAFCLDAGNRNIQRVDLGNFYKQIRKAGIPELNIEAAAVVKNILLLGSRGNSSSPQNYLIQSPEANFAEGLAIKISHLNLPPGAGISGMSYLEKEDVLLLTTSTENTASAYDDGEIGQSSLGLIYNISDKLSDHPLSPDAWIDLQAIHPDFEGQKIESVCSLKTDEAGRTTIILVSDDDKGGTRLFRLKLQIR